MPALVFPTVRWRVLSFCFHTSSNRRIPLRFADGRILFVSGRSGKRRRMSLSRKMPSLLVRTDTAEPAGFSRSKGTRNRQPVTLQAVLQVISIGTVSNDVATIALNVSAFADRTARQET
jgi:hypothetical protein